MLACRPADFTTDRLAGHTALLPTNLANCHITCRFYGNPAVYKPRIETSDLCSSEYRISLDVAKKTRQLPEYTRNKGLDKSKIQQMILQYLQNAGSTGAKRDAIFDYLKEVLPQNKTHEQQERMLGNMLSEMKENGLIVPEGRTWFLKS